MQAAEVLRGWSLQPVIGPHTTSLNVDAYSGMADERAADLLWALEDDTVKAIFCSRGGYGSMHLLNRIPLEKFRQHPKWLIGHGDITTLLYAVATTGTLCVHGPMGFQIASQQSYREGRSETGEIRGWGYHLFDIVFIYKFSVFE